MIRYRHTDDIESDGYVYDNFDHCRRQWTNFY